MMKTKTFILILVIPAVIVLIFLLLFNTPARAALNLMPGGPLMTLMQS